MKIPKNFFSHSDMENKIAVVLTTFPDDKSARKTALSMLKEGLAACAQIGGEIASIYCWKGKLCDEREIPVKLKIPLGKLDAAREFFLRDHPYECPQWIALEAEASQSYAKWVDETRPLPD